MLQAGFCVAAASAWSRESASQHSHDADETCGMVPALAPVPRHASHGASDTICMPTVTPSMASVKSTVTSPSTSLPRRGPRMVLLDRVLAVAPLKRPPRMAG